MEKKPVMIAVATTGLDDDDELIAVGLHAVPGYEMDEGWTSKVLCRHIDHDLLEKSAQHHGFTDKYLEDNAVSDEDFNAQLADVLDNFETFTYNPAFQMKFLVKQLWLEGRFPHNLPQMFKYANMHLILDSKDTVTIDTLETAASSSIVGRAPSLKRLCDANALEPLPPPALPVESSVHQLALIWEKLGNVDCQVQESLL